MILLSLLAPYLVFTQELNTNTIHEKTLQLYQNKQWKKLIEIGEKAQSQGMESYFLNYRMGVAYYEIKNYRKSAPYLEKALKRTPDDEVLLEYQYYAYLLGSQFENLQIFLNELNPNIVKNKLKTNNTDIKKIFINYANLKFNDYQIERPTNANSFNQRIRQDLYTASLGFSHRLGKSLILTHAFSILKGKHKLLNNNNQFFRDLQQNEYYLSANIFVEKNTFLKLAFHYINSDLSSENTALESTSDSYVAFVGFKKNLSLVDLMISVSYANLNDGTQVQPNLNLNFFPNGNQNFYSNSQISFQFSKNDMLSKNENGYYINQLFHFQPSPIMSIEIFGTLANIGNAITNDALVVFNDNDKINHSYGLTLGFWLFQHSGFLYFTTKQDKYETTYFVNNTASNTNYKINSIIGGLSWYL